MKINYDTVADALYMSFKKGVVKKTIKMTDRLIVDADKKGNILGMEVLDASSQLSSQKGIAKFKRSIKKGVPVSISKNLATV